MGKRSRAKRVAESPSFRAAEPVSARRPGYSAARQLWLFAAPLFLFTALLFWKSTSFAFVPYDDNEYVYKNDVVMRGVTGEGIAWAFEGAHVANWHPLTWISHMLDVELFGMDAGAHHRMGVLLHALATSLLFWMLARMTGAPWRSAMVAALFAIHPLHVESVAWVSERKDTLSGVFFMATLLAWLRYVRQPSVSRYVVTAVLFILGLMSKQMLVTLPFVLLLLDFWPLQRPIDVREKIPLFAITILASIVTFVSQRGSAVASVEAVPLATRIANAIVSYGRYLAKTFWPANLAVLYPFEMSISNAAVAGSLLVIVAITALVWWRRRTEPYLVTGWLWFLGMLVPVIGIVQIGAQSHADRYTYLPLIGIFIALVWLIPRAALIATGTVVLLVLALITNRQLEHWRDGIALFTHTVAVTRDNGVAHGALGVALKDAGRDEEAIPHLQEAVRLEPNETQAYVTLGNLLAGKGDVQNAIAAWQRAIALDPAQADVHNNLGVAYANLGRVADARAEFTRALEVDPSFEPARENLARVR